MKQLLYIVLIICFSCNSDRKFNSKNWAPYESGVIGGERKRMLSDLTQNVLKPSFTTKKEVDSLLGKYYIIDIENKTFNYEVFEKYGWNIDPEGYITLKLSFDKDSILQQWLIEETTFNP